MKFIARCIYCSSFIWDMLENFLIWPQRRYAVLSFLLRNFSPNIAVILQENIPVSKNIQYAIKKKLVLLSNFYPGITNRKNRLLISIDRQSIGNQWINYQLNSIIDGLSILQWSQLARFFTYKTKLQKQAISF